MSASEDDLYIQFYIQKHPMPFIIYPLQLPFTYVYIHSPSLSLIAAASFSGECS